ncbi:response regulator [Algoriphagus aestuarii]|nr:response regulator [Algoriphagus aestuarii]
MNFKNVLWTIPWIILSSAGGLFGQSFRFEHLTVEDGLSQNTVSAIQQDSLGYMWFGTQNGLCRYNGYEFEIFESTGNDSLTLPSNTINSIMEESNSRIWIGTSRGLCIWDQELGKINRIPLPKNENSLDSEYNVGDILLDRQGGIWLLAENNGYFVFHKKQEENSFSLKLFLDDDEGSFYGELMEDQDSTIWIGTNRSGIWIYTKETDSFKPLFDEPSKQKKLEFTSILQDKHHKIWAATLTGLYTWNPTKREFEFLPELGNRIIRRLYEDRKGRLWIGTDEAGLKLFNRTKGSFISYDHQVSNPNSLSHNSIQSIYLDPQDILWIGTYAGGVSYYNPLKPKFEIFQAGNGSSSLSNNTISGFSEDQSGNVWVATDRGGLNYWDRSKKTFTHFKADKNDPFSISSDIIQSIKSSKEGNLWVGNWMTGLDYFNKVTKKFSHLSYDPNNDSSLISNSINFIFEDTNQDLWVATTEGLSIAKSTQVKKFKAGKDQSLSFANFKNHPDVLKSLSDTYIKTIFKDSKGQIWIGTWVGLNKWDPDSRSFINFNYNPNNLALFTKDYILCVKEGKDGNLLLGTNESGLLYYDIQSNQLSRFSRQNGFPSNKILGIEKDHNGFWWISSANGLIKFNEDDKSHVVFNRHDGLSSNEFRFNANASLTSGEMVFGTNNGFTIFDPDSIKVNLTAPRVSFTRLRIFNEEVTPSKDGILSSVIGLTQQIELKHTQSSIGIDFIGINYTVPAKNTYAYQLIGVDNKWNYVGDKQSADYSFLSPGSYVFKVKASNNDGTWSEPISLSIIVHPPWWETNWFKFFGFLLVVVSLMTAFRFRSYQHRQRNSLLEQTVKSRTLELEKMNSELSEKQIEITAQKEELINQRDQLENQSLKLEELNRLKTNFFLNISHEFRTPLTLIISPLEKMVSMKNVENWPAMKRQLELMSKNGKELLGLINELLEVRNLESNGTIKISAVELDLIGFIESFILKFEDLANQFTIRLNIQADRHRVMVWFDPDIMQKVLTNLFSNAFKYTPSGGRIETRIRVIKKSDNSDKVEISISDTGVGIPSRELPFVFERFYQGSTPINVIQRSTGIGLSFVRDLIHFQGGQIFVSSKEGEGTTFTILLPLGKAHFKPEQITAKPQINEKALLIKSGHIQKANKRKRLQVLIVEDNTDVKEFLVIELEPEFEVITASNGQEGIDLALQHIPDLILSDIMMPQMDGIAMSRFIKSDLRTSHIPLILLTAKSGESSQIEGLNIGIDDYIAKPFNVKILKARVNNLISSRKKLHEIFSSKERIQVKEIIENKHDRLFIEQIDNYIFQEIKNPSLNHETLAKEVGVSKTQLYRKLQAITGQTVHEYIRSHRLKIAYDILITNPQMLILEVAYDVGFKDPAYFSKSFHDFYGKWPKEVKV